MSSKKSKSASINIGISAEAREKIVDGLSALLADSFTLYLMTHNFHWNVNPPVGRHILRRFRPRNIVLLSWPPKILPKKVFRPPPFIDYSSRMM